MMGLNMRKGIIIGLLLCSLCLIAEESTTTENQSKLEDINLKIKKNNEKLKPKKQAKRTAEQSLGKISKQLKMTELKLKKARRNLTHTKEKKILTTEKIGEIELKFSEEKKAFQKRLVQIYKIPELGIVEFLFSSDDLIMATEAHYYFDLLLQEDLHLLESLKQQQKDLQREKTQLEKQEKKIASLRRTIQSQENELEKKRKNEKKLIASLKNEIDELERQNRELMEASEEIALLIRRETYGKEGYYGTGSYIKPVNGWISSKFGKRNHPIFKRRIMHNGIDLAANTGHKIYATDSGFVLFAGQAKRYKGYGKITIISHGKRPRDKKEVSSFYAHQSKILVKKGDFVKRGDEIGWVGSTGYATGPHLHFEIRLDGKPADPLKFLDL